MLTAAELKACHYCARVVDAVTAPDHPIRRWLPALLERLQTELSTSRSRNGNVAAAEQLDMTELIGTAQAAAILGRTQRRVQQIAADLDGQTVDGRLLFRRSDVLSYKEAMSERRPA
ncbi:hypothetical protein [Mycobacterium xenopi]|uniref:Helix-turn-helix domain-containing protein n=2 Tax=Mycobacterium xenopi TaxID=1789 RepID=A0AAD1H4A2_MYCXE|nr:hypothetical protein [Mycobacterium xenopi]EUA10461.1 hypothetical protein I553_2733 [Mycobacterium xenopi 4042]EUA34579.1 hypothetical protein I552_5362 [Mycobacterium xenopi 3993]EUA54557.1 hypothetical protein I553_1567 [Mycobacterium xenopi 4042]MDA3639834.1 hypothetical protein [Mycobacterium xenopi]MDA3658194.1 hypothetical protein [Mycobacterium xenopi]